MEFNWKEFKKSYNNRIAIHCKTEREAKNFLKLCDEHGIRYFCDGRTAEMTCFDTFKSETVYGFDWDSGGGLTYGNSEFWEKYGYAILEWSDYMDKEFPILEDNMIVETKKGERYLIVRDGDIAINEYISFTIGEIKNDIVKIFDSNYSNRMGFKNIFEDNNLTVIWWKEQTPYNAKLICVKMTDDNFFERGKIYKVVDGYLKNDKAEHYGYHCDNLVDLNKNFPAKFIELVE